MTSKKRRREERDDDDTSSSSAGELTTDDEPESEPDSGPEFAMLDSVPDVDGIILRNARLLLSVIERESRATAGSAQPVLRRYQQAMKTAPPLPVSGPIQQPTGERTTSTRFPIRGLNKTKVRGTMVGGTTNMTVPNNVKQNGNWDGEGLVSGPNPKNAVRDLQFLNQISQLLLSVVDATEVEAMVVNDRILVSANEATAVQELLGKKLADLAAAYQPQGDADFDRKAAKLTAAINTVSGVDDSVGQRRMADLVVDSTIFPAQEAGVSGVLATLSQANMEILNGGLPENAAAYIRRPDLIGRIIAVAAPSSTSSTTCVHAEQSLALALAIAGWNEPAAIAGGKRPCTFCYVSLCLVQRLLCPQLRFNRNPGGAWIGTTATGLYGLATALGISLEQLNSEVNTILKGVVQHLTDPSRTAPPTAPVTDLGSEVAKKSRFRTDTGTQSDSEVDDSSGASDSARSSRDEKEEEEEEESSQGDGR